MLFGMTYAFIKLKRNEEVKAFDFFNLGLSNFGRSWKIGLREVLKLILPLIGIIVGIILMGTSVFTSAANSILGATSQSSTGMVLVGSVIVFASTIWFIVRSLLYSLTVFIAYDNPDMNSLDVINESARMMTGNRGKIFLLSLSFIGLAILATISFGIGYLWLMPYMMVAEVCFYEYLLGKNETDNSEENVEAITEM